MEDGRTATEKSGDKGAVWQARMGKLKGFSSYQYVWDGRGVWDGVTVLCAAPCGPDKPWRWFVMVRAERLWREWMRTGARVYDVVKAVLAGLGNPETGWGIMERPVPMIEWAPARVDTCRDHGGYDWTIDDLGKFATRSPAWSKGVSLSEKEVQEGVVQTEEVWTYGNKDGMTLYRGRRGSMARFLRLYNKQAQAEACGSAVWLVPFWKKCFFGDENSTEKLPLIWRAEVEFGGGWLRAHGFRTAEDLKDCEEALWRYYTTAVRHTLGKTAQLRHETPSPMWRFLAKVKPRPGAWTYEPKMKPDHERDMSHLTKQAAGCIARIVEDLYRPTCQNEVKEAMTAAMDAVRDRATAKAEGYFQLGMSQPDKRGKKAGALPAKGSPWLAKNPWDGPMPTPRKSRAERLQADPAGDADPFA